MRPGALAAGVLSLCLAAQAHAMAVPAAYHRVAREYGVPAGILFAIALTESGRASATGRVLPYPWALNVGGEALYFPDRAAADDRLARLLREGRAPDIGVMQVSWRHHRRKLGGIHTALDPWHNLRAGALVLREAFEATGDWWRAVGRYHSRTPARARAYRARVLRWYGRLG